MSPLREPALACPRAGPFFRAWVAVAAIASGALIAAAAAPAVAYRDGPPPGFSGGFGEPSCDACHFSGTLNDGLGTLGIGGASEEFVAGRTYPITLTLARPGMAVGGFQLTARFADDGAQAGTFAADSARGQRVAVIVDREIQYASQRLGGSAPSVPDTLRWVVRWTAPEGGRTVVFHAAANAADGDGSASGDYVYTTEASLAPGAARETGSDVR